ncbi:MAG: hypothetical protein FWF57_01950 [Defluviitaleaceae bacterium]|nr:hypothetical protein [Defluviitaleaceae bacterium]
MSLALAYTKTYEQAILLFRQVLREIEKYKDNQKYVVSNNSASYNNLKLRLLRAKIYDLKFNIYKADDKRGAELDLIFREIFEEAMKFYEKHNLQVHIDVSLINGGFFYGDKVLIEKGLYQLKEKAEDKLYSIMLKSLEEYSLQKYILLGRFF